MGEKETGGQAELHDTALESGPAETEQKTEPAAPTGDALNSPRWPLYVFGVAWCGWVVFLLAMLAGSKPY